MFSALVAASTLLVGAHALTPNNIMRRDNALTSLKYTNVGGSGSYNKVTNLVAGEWPSCTVSDYCQQESTTVSGESFVCSPVLLRPFNMAPRGLLYHDLSVTGGNCVVARSAMTPSFPRFGERTL